MKRFKKPCRPFPFLLLIIIFSSGLLSSCGRPLMIQAQASLDLSKEKETGDSQDDDILKSPSENLAALVLMGLGESSVGTPMNEAGDFADNKEMKTSNFQFMTGLEFIGKGYKTKGGGYKATIRRNYLEVPLNLVYVHPLSSGALFAGAGPYLAYGIGGKIKSDAGASIPTFGEDNGGYKRFDFGLGILGGYRMSNGLSVNISYDFGLANIAYASQDITAKNRTISINIGYDLSGILMKRK